LLTKTLHFLFMLLAKHLKERVRYWLAQGI
jgi:hypothetical protein